MKNSHSKSGFFNANMQIAGALPYPRTDLACESCAASENIPGTVRRRHEKYGLDITDLQVQNEEGVKHTGQRIGRYTTIACPPIRYWEEERPAAGLCQGSPWRTHNILSKGADCRSRKP